MDPQLEVLAVGLGPEAVVATPSAAADATDSTDATTPITTRLVCIAAAEHAGVTDAWRRGDARCAAR
jgi:hypothetical protein